MGEFAKQIKDITGKEESVFIKQWIDRNSDWSAMKHVEDHFLRCLKMINNDKAVTWDENQRNRREAEGRACLTLPVIGDFVHKAHGEFCMTAPQATVEPVDSEADPKTAEVLKGLIYSISYQFNGNQIHKDAAFYVFAGALAAWRVNTQYVSPESFNVEPTIQSLINPLALRWDLTASRPDLSDKKWVEILQPETKESYIEKYGEDAWRPVDLNDTAGTAKELWFAKDKCMTAEVWWVQDEEFTLYELEDGTTSRTKPEQSDVDTIGDDGKKTKKKLRTRKSYERKIWSCIIDGREVLTEPREWPDYTLDPIIPVMIATGRKLVIEGKTFYKSLITDALDIQVLINYWVTAITEAVALQPDAPYIVAEGQIKGFAEWDGTTKKSRYLRWKKDPAHPDAPPPRREQPPQMSAGMMNMLEFLHQAARNAIGMQQASMGMTSNEKSGIAIQKRKQEGDTSKYQFLDNIQQQMELEVKVLVNVLPTTMDTERIERIMGPDGKNSLVYLKQQNPKTGETINLSAGKYDARVTLGPTFSTQRDEQRDLAMQLMQTLPNQAPILAPKMVKLLNFADAEEWSELLISTLPPEARAFYQRQQGDDDNAKKIPPELMAQMQQIGQKLKQAEQIMQQQAQEMQKLKEGEALQLKELELKKYISDEDRKLEREKIMAEITKQEMKIKADKEIEYERIEKEVTLETVKLMEGTKNRREALLENFKSKVEQDKRAAASETAPELMQETEAPVAVGAPEATQQAPEIEPEVMQ